MYQVKRDRRSTIEAQKHLAFISNGMFIFPRSKEMNMKRKK